MCRWKEGFVQQELSLVQSLGSNGSDLGITFFVSWHFISIPVLINTEQIVTKVMGCKSLHFFYGPCILVKVGQKVLQIDHSRHHWNSVVASGKETH